MPSCKKCGQDLVLSLDTFRTQVCLVPAVYRALLVSSEALVITTDVGGYTLVTLDLQEVILGLSRSRRRCERSLFLVAFMRVFVFVTSLILSISGRCVSIEGGTTNIDQTSRTSVSELHSRVAQGYVHHAGELVEPLHQMVERSSGWWPLRSDSLCGRASRGCYRSWTRPGSTRFLSWRVQRTTSLSGRWDKFNFRPAWSYSVITPAQLCTLR